MQLMSERGMQEVIPTLTSSGAPKQHPPTPSLTSVPPALSGTRLATGQHCTRVLQSILLVCSLVGATECDKYGRPLTPVHSSISHSQGWCRKLGTEASAATGNVYHHQRPRVRKTPWHVLLNPTRCCQTLTNAAKLRRG